MRGADQPDSARSYHGLMVTPPLNPRHIVLLIALVLSVFIAITARVVVAVAGAFLPTFAVTLIDLCPFVVGALFLLNLRASRGRP